MRYTQLRYIKCLIFVDGETLIFRMLIVSANGGKKRSHYKISNAGMKESIFTLFTLRSEYCKVELFFNKLELGKNFVWVNLREIQSLNFTCRAFPKRFTLRFIIYCKKKVIKSDLC